MRILCFGDSNTYGYDPSSYIGNRYPSTHRWVDMLAQKLGCETINAGENGREIPRRKEELLRINSILMNQRNFDLLIIMLGSNDLLQGNPAEAVAKRMEQFLKNITLDKAKIILICPPSMQLGAWVPTQTLIDASVALRHEYKAISENLGVSFADAQEWNISLTYDGVHFTEDGHRAFAEGIVTYLNKGD